MGKRDRASQRFDNPDGRNSLELNALGHRRNGVFSIFVHTGNSIGSRPVIPARSAQLEAKRRRTRLKFKIISVWFYAQRFGFVVRLSVKSRVHNYVNDRISTDNHTTPETSWTSNRSVVGKFEFEIARVNATADWTVSTTVCMRRTRWNEMYPRKIELYLGLFELGVIIHAFQ